MKWYVYMWLREDRTPYYVGKGSFRRIHAQHKFSNGNLVPIPPLDRRVIVKYFEDEDECFFFEEWMINLYGRKEDGGILINLCKGGGGYTRGRKPRKKRDMSSYNKEYRKKNKERIKQQQKEAHLKRKIKDPEYYYRGMTKEEYNKKQRERYRQRKKSVVE
tara:strand:+ start:4502 stop:4984 length:483 start_codon:yes stop_codon:yes gene_type:complete